MNNDQYRDGDFLGTEDSARYVGITVSMLSAASALGLLDDEISNTKPSIKELGLPPKANPDNKTTYGVHTLKRLKEMLEADPDLRAKLRSIANG